jgi:diguanylate cyclase (GGDEF)-like protein
MTTQALIPLRLVIIEDNADDAELATESFKGSDFEIVRRLCVQSVNAMREALISESFDAVICVCMHSGFDISEAFAEAAKFGPAVPFIVVSEAAGTNPDRVRPLEGAVNEVPKNHLARLPEVVRRTRKAGRSPEAPRADPPDLGPGPPPTPRPTPPPTSPRTRPLSGLLTASPGTDVRRALPEVILRAVLLGLVYAAISKGINSWVAFGGGVAIASFWPAVGVTVAAISRSPRREWPWLMAGIWLAEFSVDIWNQSPVNTSIGWAFADCLEPVVAVLLFQRFAGRSPNLADPATFLRFVAFAVLSAPVVGAVLGATTSYLSGFGSWWEAFARWTVGDGIGILVIAPVLLLDRATWRSLRYRTGLRGVALLGIVAVVAIVVLGPWPGSSVPGLPFLILPFLVLQALRASHGHIALTVAVVALFTNIVAASGHGPFGATASDTAASNGLVQAQLFLALCAFTSFVVSALSSNLVARDRLEAVLRDQSLHDGLTGLGNRRLISEHCERLPRTTDRMIGLLFIDLDGFKPVNDLFGHTAGDALLVETGRRIQALVRQDDGVARLGGDEFLVLLDDIGSAEEARGMADRLTEALAVPLMWGEAEIATTASIGVAVAESRTADIEALLIEADHAMYQVKRSRKQPSPDVPLPLAGPADERRVKLLADIRLAIPCDELIAEYQPILDLRTGEVMGVEALMRWQHPTLGRIAPDEFIPLAEETGEIVEMGRWILFEACRVVATLNAASPGLRLSVNVNVSRIQLEDPAFERDIANAIRSTNLAPDLLVLEITESVLAVAVETLADRLSDVKRVGVRVAMDDFGTGYSSLSALSAFPLDYIKIDRGFVNASGEDAVAGAKLLKWVVSLGQDLGIDSVAEGIETPEQLEFLRHAGCSYGQGYLFGRPESAEAFAARLEAVEYPPES